MRDVRFAAPVALALLLVAGTASAQEAGPPGLDRGPHGVGFRLIEAADSTRAFRAKRDAGGRRAESVARPVRIALWYPARPDPDAPRTTGVPILPLGPARRAQPAAISDLVSTVVRTPVRYRRSYRITTVRRGRGAWPWMWSAT